MRTDRKVFSLLCYGFAMLFFGIAIVEWPQEVFFKIFFMGSIGAYLGQYYIILKEKKETTGA